ncbi:hypothetical protein LCGC14_0534310 [marine sediment metagenome]|uniref:Uncharacterized protein n=1 Tax=marine sediment metagenome TaxID=412755 RepID=A0A0F9SD30_9ZZZZ
MKYVTTIKNCYECRYYDHSGAFTPGGAQPVCGHPDKTRGKGTHWETRVIPHVMVKGSHSTQNRAELTEIPGWCPLRKTEVSS